MVVKMVTREIFEHLIAIHSAFPKLRIGQIISNFFSYLKYKEGKNAFYLDDNELFSYLEKYELILYQNNKNKTHKSYIF